ncbi:hypothetical protein Poli38472_010355 [Pythium oligandrum]|uniref:AB hydrolase-1 domain-containing protein n=1 Tax=Pythium oligandrum TaxID=41045 RepID=A0A8K1C2X7_PYTOL|nr:hypothetical protein Poli38472_010355 [Pythium oligandrum]|eukprot:TMW55473.1 hypothetical protein Poli38472_010355 [Pythium oligandrum]
MMAIMTTLTRLTQALRRLYDSHPQSARLALAVLVLQGVWRPVLVKWLLRWHYRATAETPQLYYQKTAENEALLRECRVITQEKYYAPWYLFNGHLQTFQLSREDQRVEPLVKYERQTLDMPDGGILSLDWAIPPRNDRTIPRVSEIDPTRRTMLILPGLTGGSNDFYIRSVVHRMVALGWQVVVMNARGCANTPLKNAQFFCIAYTEDLRYVLKHLNTKYQFRNEALALVGFSMGSNVVVKYLGEEQEHAKTQVTAAISVGNPFDVVACSQNLSSTLFYRLTYEAVLTKNLLRLFFHQSNAHEVFHDHPDLDLVSLRQSKTLVDFDDRFTRIVFNYPSVFAFYSDASSGPRLDNVRVPLLCLNAKDDPISTAGAIPYEATQRNSNVILCVTERGGHLAFYEGEHEGSKTEKSGKSAAVSTWSAKVIGEYAESVRKQHIRHKE